MTDTATGTIGRAVALHALLAGATAGQEVPAPPVAPTGVVVYAGGDVERLLIGPSTLTYRDGAHLYRAPAEVGDTIQVTPAQATRLDRLGATLDPAAATEVVEDAQRITDAIDAGMAATPPAGVTFKTDDELKALKAADLVAYVGQYPQERARVRALEELRGPVLSNGKGARSSVLNATEPTPLEDDQVAAQVQAQQEADEAANAANEAPAE